MTILTAEDTSKLLFDYPDLIFFIDKSNYFALITDLCFDSRVHVEFFSFYQVIHEGIRNPILNVDVGRLGPLPRVLYVLATNPNFIAMSTKAAHTYVLKSLSC